MKSYKTIAQAASFAALAHSGQLRKGSKEPYINHPLRVGARLATIPNVTPELVTAGILHDVIEDTPVTYEEVKTIFGKTVADLVLSVTKNKALSKKQANAEYLQRFKEADSETVLLKLVDRLDNLKSMAGMSSTWKQNYLRGTRDLLDVVVKRKSLFSAIWQTANRVRSFLEVWTEIKELLQEESK